MKEWESDERWECRIGVSSSDMFRRQQYAMLCSEHMAMMRGVSKLLGRELALVGIIL